jgi:hypothetical protein
MLTLTPYLLFCRAQFTLQSHACQSFAGMRRGRALFGKRAGLEQVLHGSFSVVVSGHARAVLSAPAGSDPATDPTLHGRRSALERILLKYSFGVFGRNPLCFFVTA